jgi:hypothetical protein
MIVLCEVCDKAFENYSEGPDDTQSRCQRCQCVTNLMACCTNLCEFWQNGTPVQAGSEIVAELRAAMKDVEDYVLG